MVCRKLALQEGERVLDVGCGWGSFPLWAATRHGASVVGITLSPPQAEKARQRAEAAGVADRVEIRVMDYRDLAGERFDAIASIGMVEHVGAANIDVYAGPSPACSSRAGACSTTASPASATPTPRPAPSRSATSSPTPRRSTSRGSCWRSNGPASSPATSRSSAPTTPRPCATGPRRLDENLDEAVRLAGPERVRVWRLYLRAARNGFETGFTSIYQARCTLG